MKHKFKVDSFSNVIASDSKGGSIKEQTVSVLLLFEILQELQAQRVLLSRIVQANGSKPFLSADDLYAMTHRTT